MKRLKIAAVGRLKTPCWRDAAEYYQKKLTHAISVEHVTVKDADSSLPLPERKQVESDRLLRLVRPGDVVICMDENGDTMPSRALAAFLSRLWDNGKAPCFIVGGAYGLSRSLLDSAAHTLSFGPMTFPHELARVMLLEQIYRVGNILAGTGYHH